MGAFGAGSIRQVKHGKHSKCCKTICVANILALTLDKSTYLEMLKRKRRAASLKSVTLYVLNVRRAGATDGNGNGKEGGGE